MPHNISEVLSFVTKHSGLFVLLYFTHAHSGQLGPEDGVKEKKMKGPTACQVIFMKTWLTYIQETRSQVGYLRCPVSK